MALPMLKPPCQRVLFNELVCAHKVMLSINLVSYFLKEFPTLHWVQLIRVCTSL